MFLCTSATACALTLYGLSLERRSPSPWMMRKMILDEKMLPIVLISFIGLSFDVLGLMHDY